MNFDVYGPFVVPRTESKHQIDRTKLPKLLKEMEDVRADLPSACGCYMFCLRAGKGYRPWYVGLTLTNTLFDEAFNPSNLNKYNPIVDKLNGTPVMFFIPMVTSTGVRFRKQNEKLRSIKFLEQWLIGEALRKNPDLLNKQNTKFLRELHVRGLLNPKHGEGNQHTSALKKALR